MVEVRPAPPRERITVEDAGRRYIAHLQALGRKRSTIQDYHSYLRIHLAPAFAQPLARITREDIEGFMAGQARCGLAPKSVRLHLSLLHGIFAFAQRRGWAEANPVALVDKPSLGDGAGDTHWLDHAELEALLRAVPDDVLGPTDRALYLTAAMTGLRQGELRALRWRDIDWPAMRVRVRRNIVRGEYGTPKSKRGSRSVPLADRVARELERHLQRSAYGGDDDLVFAHPETGNPYDRSKLRKRFKSALRAAGVREVTFHDLRHTFGTRMAAAGCPDADAPRVLYPERLGRGRAWRLESDPGENLAGSTRRCQMVSDRRRIGFAPLGGSSPSAASRCAGYCAGDVGGERRGRAAPHRSMEPARPGDVDGLVFPRRGT
jgi:integrase